MYLYIHLSIYISLSIIIYKYIFMYVCMYLCFYVCNALGMPYHMFLFVVICQNGYLHYAAVACCSIQC